MSKEALKLAKAWFERNTYGDEAAEVYEAIEQALEQPVQEPLEYWNEVEGWVKIDEVREHFDSVGCGTIYKTAGDGRVPLTAAKPTQQKLWPEPFGYFQYDIRLDAWVQNCINNKGVAFYTKEKP
jgi:hypothetical protein